MATRSATRASRRPRGAAGGGRCAAAADGTGLAKLKRLYLRGTQVTDAGCATLAAALDSGALPALEMLDLDGIPASTAAKAAVYEALANLKDGESESENEESGSESEEDEAQEDDDGRGRLGGWGGRGGRRLGQPHSGTRSKAVYLTGIRTWCAVYSNM